MTALRWTRRLLDVLLVVAALAVVVTAATQLLAPVAGGRAMVIGGGSMEPAIGRGAFVLALPAGIETYAVGDVVTVQQGGATPYTHRITRLAELAGVPYVETKGDANAAPDPAIVPTGAIMGRSPSASRSSGTSSCCSRPLPASPASWPSARRCSSSSG